MPKRYYMGRNQKGGSRLKIGDKRSFQTPGCRKKKLSGPFGITSLASDKCAKVLMGKAKKRKA